MNFFKTYNPGPKGFIIASEHQQPLAIKLNLVDQEWFIQNQHQVLSPSGHYYNPGERGFQLIVSPESSSVFSCD